MPFLDLQDLFFDPDFTDSAGSGLVYLRRTAETIDNTGRAVLVPTDTAITASVQPADGDVLALLPDEERVQGSIAVYTATPLRSATDTTSPDQVVFKGRAYTVTVVHNWGDWGRGQFMAVCVPATMAAPTS